MVSFKFINGNLFQKNLKCVYDYLRTLSCLVNNNNKINAKKIENIFFSEYL